MVENDSFANRQWVGPTHEHSFGGNATFDHRHNIANSSSQGGRSVVDPVSFENGIGVHNESYKMAVDKIPELRVPAFQGNAGFYPILG